MNDEEGKGYRQGYGQNKVPCAHLSQRRRSAHRQDAVAHQIPVSQVWPRIQSLTDPPPPTDGGFMEETMLRYPRLIIPEECFDWIYSLSTELEPKATLYLWGKHQQDIKDSWTARLKAKELQTNGDGVSLEALCLPLMKRFPRIHCFFTYFIDAYLMTGRLNEAKELVEKRKQWMIRHPYKIISLEAIELGARDPLIRLPDGHEYKQSMGDWISSMRTLQFYEIDIQNKIDTGFVFKARRKKNQ